MPHHLDNVPALSLSKAAPLVLRTPDTAIIEASRQARLAQAIATGGRPQGFTVPAVAPGIGHGCRQAAEKGHTAGTLQATLKLEPRHIAGTGDGLPQRRPGGSAAVTEGPAQGRPRANVDYR